MGAVNLKWVGSTLMIGVDSRGNSIVIGTESERDPNWRGMKPSDLLLLSAASCSTYDVVTILAKKKEPLISLEVVCSGDQLPDPPFTFTNIHLHYIARGITDPRKLKQAIHLSVEKYCSVISTLSPGVPVNFDFEILPT